MSAKTSLEVVQRQKSCSFLLTALHRQGTEITEKLLETVEPHLRAGDKAPEFFATVVGLGRRLEATLGRLVTQDEKVYSASARLSQLLRERDDHIISLNQMVSRLRHGILSQFRKPKLEGLGIGRRNPRQPIEILRIVERMSQIFERGDFEDRLGESFFAQTFDPRAQVAEIVPAADELRRVLRRIDEAKQDLGLAVTEKKRIQKEYDLLFLHTARTFEAFCRLAGEKELADRVRPSVRRPGRTRQKPDAEDESSSPAVTRPRLVPDASQAS